MISKRTVTQAYRIASKLNPAKKLAYRTTQMRELVNSSLYPSLECHTLREESLIQHITEYSENSGGVIEESHASKLNELANLYSNAIVQRMTLLRGRVMPFADKIARQFADAVAQPAFNYPQIELFNANEMLLNDQIVGSIAATAKLSTDMVPTDGGIIFRGGFLERDEETLLNMIVNDAAAIVKEDILNMLATKDEGWLADVYKRYFLEGTAYPVKDLDVIRNYGLLEEGLMVYGILGRMVVDDIVDAGLNLSLGEYRHYISSTWTMLADVLSRQLSILASKMRYHNFILDIRKGGIDLTGLPSYTIVVNESVYNDYIAQGGTPEAVFELVISDTRFPMNLQMLLDNVPALTEGFNRRYMAVSNQKRNNLHETLVSRFPYVMMQCLREEPIDFQLLFLNPEQAEQFNLNDEGQKEAILSVVCQEVGRNLDAFNTDNVFDIIVSAIISNGLARYNLYPFYSRLKAMAAQEPETETGVLAFRILAEELVQRIIADHVTEVKPF